MRRRIGAVGGYWGDDGMSDLAIRKVVEMQETVAGRRLGGNVAVLVSSGDRDERSLKVLMRGYWAAAQTFVLNPVFPPDAPEGG